MSAPVPGVLEGARTHPARPGGVARALAGATGWCYRTAKRAGLTTRASRQDAAFDRRAVPRQPPISVAGAGGRAPLRVLVLGNGLAESPGAGSFAEGFPNQLARSLADRLHRRVEVKTLVGGAWDLQELDRRLREEQLHWHDVLVVTAAYRPTLAEVPLKGWSRYVESLRATLVEAAGPEAVIRVLSLPWRTAAHDAPLEWGGLFGLRVRVVAEIAEAVLTADQPALPLRLRPPLRSTEWRGPAFSPQTYLRWADQVASDLAAALPR